MYSTKEVAEKLNISRGLVFRALQDGRIRGIKMGSVWRVSEEEVERVKREGF